MTNIAAIILLLKSSFSLRKIYPAKTFIKTVTELRGATIET